MRDFPCLKVWLVIFTFTFTSIAAKQADAFGALYSMNQRFGISYDAASQTKSLAQCDYLSLGHLGWYSDGQIVDTKNPGSLHLADGWTIEHLTIAGLTSQSLAKNTAESIYRSNPASISSRTAWQIGGRLGIDCYTKNQIHPSVASYLIDDYVRDVHLWHDQISQLDVPVQIMSGAIIPKKSTLCMLTNIDFISLAMKRYYQQYHESMPINVFNLQIYLDAGENPLETVKSTVQNFRRWLADVDLGNGLHCDYSASELWITACGLADQKLSSQQAIDQLRRITQWLMGTDDADIFDPSLGPPADDFRLVQRWAWQSLTVTSQFNPNTAFFDNAGQLTPAGAAYADLMAIHCPEPAAVLLYLLPLALVLKK